MLGKKLITFILVLLCLIISKTQASKSVFIIGKHVGPSQAQAYRIEGTQVTLQGTMDISTYNLGAGCMYNYEFLFEVNNAKTMISEEDLVRVSYQGLSCSRIKSS